MQQTEKMLQAEALYREALEGFRRSLGSQHPDTLMLLANFTGLLRELNKVLSTCSVLAQY